jgi:hypothetical protein
MAITTLADALQTKNSLRKTTKQETSNLPKSNLPKISLPSSYQKANSVYIYVHSRCGMIFCKILPSDLKGLPKVNPES